jgi:hypothetical protein
MEPHRPAQIWVGKNPKTTALHLCRFCPHIPIFRSADVLSQHIRTGHQDGSQAQQGPTTNWNMTGQIAIPRSPEGLQTVAEDVNHQIVALKIKCKAEQNDSLKLGLYRDLLDEYCDLFHVSQLPSTSTTQQGLAYNMRDEVWSECIYLCLGVLQKLLPDSPYSTTDFITYAYQRLCGLYETVPIYRETWTEYLGHLIWQKALIEGDLQFRETLVTVAIQWYSEASDRAPVLGKRYMNLAKASPDVLEELFYYSKALCAVTAYPPARDSILAFEHDKQNVSPLVTALLKAYHIILTNEHIEALQSTIREFTGLLSDHIHTRTDAFTRDSVYIAISNITAMLGFGSKENPLMKSLFPSEPVSEITGTTEDPLDYSSLHAETLANETAKVFLLPDIKDLSLLPFIHVVLVFINFMCHCHRRHIIRYLATNFRSSRLVKILNELLASFSHIYSLKSTRFPKHHYPLTEDLEMRGLLWAQGYYPLSWFTVKKIADEQKPWGDDYHVRKERILWLAFGIARTKRWIYYNEEARLFTLVEGSPGF